VEREAEVRARVDALGSMTFSVQRTLCFDDVPVLLSEIGWLRMAYGKCCDSLDEARGAYRAVVEARRHDVAALHSARRLAEAVSDSWYDWLFSDWSDDERYRCRYCDAGPALTAPGVVHTSDCVVREALGVLENKS
jgi:hypothetical protein